ncbi:hypothetical protein [Lacipirellula sp.]|uniref:hypothetical protein n=1 Tax=Lacipirellula sp. TaxID=2691419 RepID=UPI003D10A790
MNLEEMNRTTMNALAASDGFKTNAQLQADRAKADSAWADQAERKAKELGRDLLPDEFAGIGTIHEAISPKLRRPLADPEPLMAAKNWKPVVASDPATSVAFDAEIAKLQAELDHDAEMKAFENATPKGRTLLELQRLKRKELETRANAAAIEDHLKNQAPTLAALRELKDWARWESRVDVAQWQTIENAIVQCELVGGCPQERERLVQAAKAVRAGVVKEQQDEYNAKVAQLKGERDKLDRELRAMAKLSAEPSDASPSPASGSPDEAAYWRAKGIAEGDPGKYWEPAAA